MASKNTKKLKWGCCKDQSKDDTYSVCITCKKGYHHACLPTVDMDDPEWKCPNCVPKAIRNDQTPVGTSRGNVTLRAHKRQAIGSPADAADGSPIFKDDVSDIVRLILKEQATAAEPPVTRNEVKTILQEVLQSELSGLIGKIKSDMSAVMCTELKVIKEEITDVKEAMNFINAQFEDIAKTRQEDMNLVKDLSEQNKRLEDMVNEQNIRINQLEQQARSNNVEIQCVPERRDENILETIKSISKVIDYDLKDNDVSKCTRTAKYNQTSPRPRSIVVQFTTPRIRDSFMAAAIEFNKAKKDRNDKLNGSLIGFRENSPIFITDHLSPANKALHAAARMKSKEKGYKFTWVRSGRIYVRKNEESEYIFVKDSKCLDKIL